MSAYWGEGRVPQESRPVSDVCVGGWQPRPLYAQIDEPDPGDADFVHSPGGPAGDAFEVRLGPVCRPVTGDHRLKVRLRASDPCPKLAKVELLQGPAAGSSASSSSSSSASAGCPGDRVVIASRVVAAGERFATYELVLTAAEVDRITDYHDLRLRVTAYADVACSSSSSSGASGSSSSGSSGSSESSVSSLSSVSLASGSSSSGSPSFSSQSAPSPTGPCCQGITLPDTLYVTYTAGCGQRSVALTNEGGGLWTGHTGPPFESEPVDCDQNASLTFGCSGGAFGVTDVASFCGPSGTCEVTVVSCSPFLGTFSGCPVTPWDGCSGTVSGVISETAP